MAYLDVHNEMKVCLVTPGSEGSGDVILNQTDYTKDESGSSVSLDGSDGQVMLRIPKFNYAYSFDSGANTHSWTVGFGDDGMTGLHPWFTKEGVEVDYRYVGVYPACLYDDSASSYIDGVANDDNTSLVDLSNDKIGSVVGYKPFVGLNRAQFRSLASNIGTGWSQLDFWGYNALKLLYITKYANLDSQTVLGSGNTRFNSFDYDTQIGVTGKVLSVNATGQSTVGGDIGDYSNTFGIEDFYGGVWGFVDGWNVIDLQNYYCQNPSEFADDTTTNYISIGSTMPATNGYQETFQNNVAMILNSIGSSSMVGSDYYYQNSGNRVAHVGGRSTTGLSAGAFCLSVSTSSSYSSRSGGARACY